MKIEKKQILFYFFVTLVLILLIIPLLINSYLPLIQSFCPKNIYSSSGMIVDKKENIYQTKYGNKTSYFIKIMEIEETNTYNIEHFQFIFVKNNEKVDFEYYKYWLTDKRVITKIRKL